jgi:hypothetical protein
MFSGPDMTIEEAQRKIDCFAALVSKHLNERLKEVLPQGFLYDKEPIETNSIVSVNDKQVRLDRLWQTSQFPINDLELHESTRLNLISSVDAVVAKISNDIKGKALLVSRPPVHHPPGLVADIKGFGMRIVVRFNLAVGNYIYIESLYGVT